MIANDRRIDEQYCAKYIRVREYKTTWRTRSCFCYRKSFVAELGSIGGEGVNFKFMLDGLCTICTLSQSNVANSGGNAPLPDPDGIVFSLLSLLSFVRNKRSNKRIKWCYCYGVLNDRTNYSESLTVANLPYRPCS